MSRSLTIKNIKTLIEDFCGQHLQINEVLKGDIFEIDLKKYVSGSYFIWDVVAINPTGENGLNYTIDLFVCDNVTDINNESNIVSVQNECSLICLDFAAYLQNYNAQTWQDEDKNIIARLEGNWNITPFEKRFDSLYGGASMSLTIGSYFSYQRCKIPTN